MSVPPSSPPAAIDRSDEVWPPLAAGAVMAALLIACCGALLHWWSLPVAAAAGIGFMEGGPLRRRLGLRVAVVATLAAAVVVVAVGAVGDTPVRYAVAAGVVAAAAGLSSRWGLYPAAVFPAVAVVALSSPVDQASAVPRAAALIGGALLGAVLLGLLRLDPPASSAVVSTRRAVLTAALLGVLVGTSLLVAEELGAFQGHWVALSIVTVAVPSVQASQERSMLRTVGTVGGAVAAAAAAWVLPAGTTVLVLALVAAVASVLVRSDEWRIGLVTVGVILLGGGGTVSLDHAAARVAATVIGAAVVVAATTVVGLLAAPEVDVRE